jgi:hypothetical protein
MPEQTPPPDQTPPPVQPRTVEQLEAEQRAEYGTFVATVPIYIDGARAFNPGHAVPVSHVERGLVREDQVAKLSTKVGRQAAGIEE